MAAFGRGGERRGEGGGSEGEAQRPRGRAGVSGREARGGGGAGALILPVAGEVVRRGRPLFRPRSGEQGRGRAGEVGWAGGRPSRARGPVGGRAFSFFSFFLCSFAFSFYLFIFFSVLFHLKVFRYFIKMCFLHHNYQCIIWHPPNIFV